MTTTATSAERRVVQLNWTRLSLHREASTTEGTVNFGTNNVRAG